MTDVNTPYFCVVKKLDEEEKTHLYIKICYPGQPSTEIPINYAQALLLSINLMENIPIGSIKDD